MAKEVINKQDEIKIIENEVEAVRKLADVYIGALGNDGFLNMVREIVQNSLDEIIKGNTLDLNIHVSYDEKTHIVIVEDYGQGIDHNVFVQVFSVLHSSSNYDKVEGSGRFSSGKNGMGGTITNFLSKFFIAESYRMDGTAKMAEWHEGKLVSEKNIKCPKGKHGMKVTFAPSDMMGEITVTVGEIGRLLWLLCNMSKIGTTIHYSAIDIHGKTHKNKIVNTRGMSELYDSICAKQLTAPVSFMETDGTMKLECMLSYDLNDMNPEPIIMSFANTCPTSGGTHVDGVMDAFVKYFREYMNKIYLANNNKLTVTIQDIRTGLRGVISCYHLFPMFTGQSKDIFSEKSMFEYAKDVTTRQLNAWASSNPTDLQKIAKYLKSICEIRTKMDGEKVKINDKYEVSAVTGFSSKYKKPNGKGPFEVIFVEGDSAANENSRDKETQGLMPLRGKIPNPITTPPAKFFANEEIASAVHIFGYKGYQKVFDPDKFKPEKVIILTDADADGDHIASLLCLMFIRYFPFVITSGKLYRATPPLYGLSLGNGKMKYFIDNADYLDYVYDTFVKKYDVRTAKNKPISKKDLNLILERNMDYFKEITRICNIHSLDPHLLETVLSNRNLLKDSSKFKRVIEKLYKFVTVGKMNGVTYINGLVNSKIQNLFCNDILFTDSSKLLKMIETSEVNYIINGQPATLYDLMRSFREFEPLTRYKGLGEMPTKELATSTIMPGYGRVLKQYTIDDVAKQLKYVREVQSSKDVFVKNVGTIRKEDIV